MKRETFHEITSLHSYSTPKELMHIPHALYVNSEFAQNVQFGKGEKLKIAASWKQLLNTPLVMCQKLT